MGRRLPKSFYKRAPEVVAQELLGHRLVRILPNGERLSGQIIETEAYLGFSDDACHTYGAHQSERVAAMYLGGGHWYVYFIYGCHFCVNAVTGPVGSGQAVLLRALVPIEGIPVMHAHRKTQKQLPNNLVTHGPGRLCRALQIDRLLNGTKSYGDTCLFVEVGAPVELKNKINSGPRIGLSPSCTSRDWPLRFFL